jgi:hypothetical protein
MPLDPLHGLHPSHEARSIFACLCRRGGSMRVGPLLRGLGSLGLDERTILDAIVELGELYWITIAWRKTAPGATGAEKPLAGIDRLTATRFGRRKYRSAWPLE